MQQVKEKVKHLLSSFSGHGFDHIERVYMLSKDLALKEGGDITIVSLAALLHDVDDYKFVGIKNAPLLLNAKRIMDEACIDISIQQKVCDIILNMGYTNRLKGIYPTSLEGKIVSDADMLDAMGAMAIIRTLEYGIEKKSPVFDKDIFPNSDLTVDAYQKKANGTDTILNHFFDKLLKLKYLLFTDTAKHMGEERHQLMVDFLTLFFKQSYQERWQSYLNEYLDNLSVFYKDVKRV